MVIVAAIILIAVIVGALIFYLQPRGEEEKTFKVALILPGSIQDGCWNFVGYWSLMQLKTALNVTVSYTEWVTTDEQTAVMRSYAEQGYNLIIAHSFGFGDALWAVSKDFPKVDFLWSAGSTQYNSSNFAAAPTLMYESAYLGGMVAGAVTKSNIIGYVGGFQIEAPVTEYNAFKLGAEQVNSNVTTKIAWSGSFSDTIAGKQTAAAMVEQGADVIVGSGDGQSRGVVEECNEAGIYGIGFVADQNDIYPNTVITSLLYNYGPVYTEIAKEIMDGTFHGGIFNWGMAKGVTDIAPFHGLADKVPLSVQVEINQTRAEIENSTFVVPYITTLPS